MAESVDDLSRWVRELQSDDPAVWQPALDHLVMAGYQRIEAMAKKMMGAYALRQTSQTTELVNEAWMKLRTAMNDARLRRQFDGVDRFFGLVFLQVKRVALTLTEKRDRVARNQPLPEDAGMAAPPDDATPSNAEEWSRFLAAVDRLPEPMSAHFNLVWFGEMGYSDAAAILGFEEWTVRRGYAKACRLLYDALDGRLPTAFGPPPEK